MAPSSRSEGGGSGSSSTSGHTNTGSSGKITDKTSWNYVLRSGVAGGVAGCVAKSAIAPLDRVKILFQAQNPEFQKYSGKWLGVFQAGRDIVRSDGPMALFQGHSATLMRIFPYAAIKYMAYDKLHFYLMPTRDQETSGRLFLAGSASGVLSVFMTYPLELIRVRLAFETKRKRQKGGLRRIINMIYTEGTTEAPFSSDARKRAARIAAQQTGKANLSTSAVNHAIATSAATPISAIATTAAASAASSASTSASTSSLSAFSNAAAAVASSFSGSNGSALTSTKTPTPRFSSSSSPPEAARPPPLTPAASTVAASSSRVTSASSAAASAAAATAAETRTLWAADPHVPSSAVPPGNRLLSRYPILKFYRGFSVTVLGMIPYAGTSFLVFGRCKTVLQDAFPPAEPAVGVAGSRRKWWWPSKTVVDLSAGALAGALSQTAAYPFEVIRRRQQVGGIIRPGAMLGMWETAAWIYKTSGWRGFYVGLSIGFLKVVPMTSISFAVWLGMKRQMGI